MKIAFSFDGLSRLTNALYINSSHSPTKLSQPASLTTYVIVICVQPSDYM